MGRSKSGKKRKRDPSPSSNLTKVELARGHQIIEREASTEDLITRTLYLTYQAPKGRKEPTPQELERRKKRAAKNLARYAKKQTKLRKQRAKEGLCTKCGKEPPVEGGKMGEKCRKKGRVKPKWMTETASFGYL